MSLKWQATHLNLIYCSDYMEENSANNSIRKVCRTCVAIRLFIVSLLFLVIISILAKENLGNKFDFYRAMTEFLSLEFVSGLVSQDSINKQVWHQR